MHKIIRDRFFEKKRFTQITQIKTLFAFQVQWFFS